ncbi:hypothetical protein P4O66_000056 [Electrophorus voltai]|uniref:Uncharacterized protein n=1 Tax=Electrophorus voltai TaxID=2609070 RepID=A0AAD9E6F4_9TELE|nr:hypothetical protein P4O66_000056 [Electrophorus voltai]
MCGRIFVVRVLEEPGSVSAQVKFCAYTWELLQALHIHVSISNELYCNNVEICGQLPNSSPPKPERDRVGMSPQRVLQRLAVAQLYLQKVAASCVHPRKSVIGRVHVRGKEIQEQWAGIARQVIVGLRERVEGPGVWESSMRSGSEKGRGAFHEACEYEDHSECCSVQLALLNYNLQLTKRHSSKMDPHKMRASIRPLQIINGYEIGRFREMTQENEGRKREMVVHVRPWLRVAEKQEEETKGLHMCGTREQQYQQMAGETITMSTSRTPDGPSSSLLLQSGPSLHDHIGHRTVQPSDMATELLPSGLEVSSPTEPRPTEPSLKEPRPTEPSPTEPRPTEPSLREPRPTEPRPTEPSLKEHSPTEPSLREPSPTEPSLREPSLREPSPTEPSPTEPSLREPSPTEPSPTEPSLREPRPTEPSPTEPSLREPSLREHSPTEPSPTEPGLREPSPTEHSPTEHSPTEPSLREPRPTEPSPTEPSLREPSLREHSPTEPSPTEPGLRKPSPTEHSPTEPSLREPSPTEPSLREPSLREPRPTEPSPTEPSLREPSPTEPSPTEPSPTEPSLS